MFSKLCIRKNQCHLGIYFYSYLLFFFLKIKHFLRDNKLIERLKYRLKSLKFFIIFPVNNHFYCKNYDRNMIFAFIWLVVNYRSKEIGI